MQTIYYRYYCCTCNWNRNYGCMPQDVQGQKISDKNVFVEEIHNGEFDYLIRFSEENEDPYYYCFHDEGCHIIYHRFLPEDYEDFGF